MANLERMSRLVNVLTGIRELRGEGEEDSLKQARGIATLQSTLLDIEKKRRELGGPSPREKYTEEQRSQQVGSALEMFGNLYKTASPASKKLLGEQLTSLWGVMSSVDKEKYKMIVNHTPINPRVQKAMWFEETNPRPKMPIVREGDGSWTNRPPRTPEYRKVWAEFDVAAGEWETLKQMAIEEKKPEEVGMKGVPRQYQTDDPNVTAERNPLTRRIEFTNWNEIKSTQGEIQTAIDKGWATWEDIKTRKSVPISVPREYVLNGRPVTVRQVKDVRSGATRLQYDPAGPLDESKMKPPKELTDAIHLVDNDILPSTLEVKAPAVIGLYSQLKDIIDSTKEERLGRQLELQRRIVEKYPSEQRFIPFIPPPARQKNVWYRIQQIADWIPGLAYLIPTPSPGKQGNVVLVQADRLVSFLDREGEEKFFWWSDRYNVAYDIEGIPIEESYGKVPGEQLDLAWSK